MTEENEISETRLGLTQAVRDTLGRCMLSVSYRNLKASGQIPESAQVKPAPPSDIALIVAAYEYLQASGQLPEAAADVIMCVQSSDALTDFFEMHGLSKCKEAICNFVGIETAADLAIITEADVHGTRFREWATENLSIVQHRKVLVAFAASAH
jgi:hypothetical protein